MRDYLYGNGNLALIIHTSTETVKDSESQPKYKLVELKDVSQFEHAFKEFYRMGTVDDKDVCFVFYLR